MHFLFFSLSDLFLVFKVVLSGCCNLKTDAFCIIDTIQEAVSVFSGPFFMFLDREIGKYLEHRPPTVMASGHFYRLQKI